MFKKSSPLDKFLLASILAPTFDPSDSEDIDVVIRKIVDGFDVFGIIKSNDFDKEEGLAA